MDGSIELKKLPRLKEERIKTFLSVWACIKNTGHVLRLISPVWVVRRILVDFKTNTIQAITRSDDWTGFKSTKERRKAQNRLNQRAARRRKDPEKSTHLRSKIEDVRHGHQRSALLTVFERYSQPSTTISSTPLPQQPDISLYSPVTTNVEFEVYFPLPVDHRLFTLIAHNVVRGFLTNQVILQGPPIFACDILVEDLCQLTPLPRPVDIPSSLHPTILQQTVPHPPWVDLFPIAAVRDTVIKSMGMFDGLELCDDSVGMLFKDSKSMNREFEMSMRKEFQGVDGLGNKGLIIWGEPWDAGSWEITEDFLMRWGWMFRNCYEEVLKATNHWRSMRSEEPLVWRVGAWKSRVEVVDDRIVEEIEL